MHLPGIFEKTEFYDHFLQLYHEEPDMFNDWMEIESIYGNPSTCIWGGGRQGIFYCDEYFIKDIAEEFQVKIGLTFSNLILKEEHISDTYCNFLLKLFDKQDNYIIVSSPILENYIKQNYPNYKLISSTTKCLSKFQELEEELNNPNFDLVCLDYNFNNIFPSLEKIKDKDRCEILVNPVCKRGCPYAKWHYTAVSKTYFHDFDTGDDPGDCMTCSHQGIPLFKALKQSTFITPEDIRDKYMPLGFKHFKIEGRNRPRQSFIEVISYYMIKPERQIEFRERCTW